MPEMYYGAYSHAMELHLRPSDNYMGEDKRSKRFHKNVDSTGSYIHLWDQ
jgi:hypothetical protein